MTTTYYLETRPIAGTRPRGSSGIQDIELSNELINSDIFKASLHDSCRNI